MSLMARTRIASWGRLALDLTPFSSARREESSVEAEDKDPGERGEQVLLDKLDADDDDNRREVDAAEDHRQMFAEEIEDRIGQGMEGAHDGIVRIGFDPRHDGGRDHDVKIEGEEPAEDLRDPDYQVGPDEHVADKPPPQGTLALFGRPF